jgi:hypothetical protein
MAQIKAMGMMESTEIRKAFAFRFRFRVRGAGLSTSKGTVSFSMEGLLFV